MALRTAGIVLFVGMVLAVTACTGASDDGDTGGKTDNLDVVLDVALDDLGTDDVSDGVSRDVPDVCTCTTTDDCCDGCLPIAELAACGPEGACLVRGACQAGTCVGAGPVVCDSPEPCQELSGTCDPETNACQYPVKADGATCEAIAGKDGSGYCLAATCLGFGICDHRTYDQPVAYACNFDGECASGRCAAWGDGWMTYCTAPCGGDQPECPTGTACARSGAEFLCRPLAAERTLPNDASYEAYQVCNHDSDCAGNLCLGIDGKKFCTKSCDDGNGKASAALCEPCGECRSGGEALGFKYELYCVPSGILEAGQPCGMSSDCAKRFCQSGLCSEQCFILEDISTCPTNMDCVPGVIESDLTIQVCVPKGEAGHGFGEDCLGNYACADGRTCVDILGTMRCSAVCSDEAPCVDGTCTDTASGKVCVPPDMIGIVAQGGDCKEPFQCVEGLQCYMSACLKPCEAPADCTGENATCYPDLMIQAAYCTTGCVAGSSTCPPRMGCFQGACVLTRDGQSYIFSTCRQDGDCETGNCVAGTCTDSCSETIPCEGSEPIEPVPFGVCQSCDPALYGSDCDASGYGLNECIQGSDGVNFCAISCMLSPICPLGTRCYSTGYSDVCAPITGSCSATTACSSKGVCIRPVADGSPCGEDAECVGNKCVDGTCRTGTCIQDEDCECEALACTGGACRPSLVWGLAEVEPNNTKDKAQILQGNDSFRVAATLYSQDTSPDVDLYRVSLTAGQALDVRTQPFCGLVIDTNLRLLNLDGVALEGWENDDLDPSGDFSSLLLGYVAFQDQQILVEVTQSPWTTGFAKFSYVLDARIFSVDQADTCDGAETLATGSHHFDLQNSVNTYTAPSCTGQAAFGKDSAFAVVVPDNQVLRVSLDSPFDGQVYVVTDCGSSDTTCLAGADSSYDGGTEKLIYWNRTGSDQTLFLIVDSLLPQDDMTFDLTVSVEDSFVPANDGPDAEGIPTLGSGVPTPGTLVGANGDYDPTATGCGGKALPGPDVVYKVELPGNSFVAFEVLSTVGFTPALWLTTDLSDPAKCVAAGIGMTSWTNNGVDPVTVYVILDMEKVDGYGDYEIQALYGTVGPIFGACDPATYVDVCVAEGQPLVARCDSTHSYLVAFDCDNACKVAGAKGGICHLYTAPGYEQSWCMCDYDCTAEVTTGHCANGYFTNCSCAAADPCGWKANNSCEEICSIEFPSDSFVDPPEDCPPPT